MDHLGIITNSMNDIQIMIKHGHAWTSCENIHFMAAELPGETDDQSWEVICPIPHAYETPLHNSSKDVMLFQTKKHAFLRL